MKSLDQEIGKSRAKVTRRSGDAARGKSSRAKTMIKTLSSEKLGRKGEKKGRKKLLIIGLVSGIVFAIATAVILILTHQPVKTPASKPLDKPDEPIAAPQKFYSPLTGRETTEAKLTAPVLAVMIENSPEARPQSGLKDAGVVFEAVAEGGITRFIALYQETEPALIGPVRSVRPYYIEWAAAFDPAIAHVGGSNDALAMVQSGKYGVNLDQFFNAGSFWRATDRAAPHNVYTDFTHMAALMTAKGKASSQFTAWPRQDGKPTEIPDASSVDLAVSTGSFAVHYDYDSATNTYQRFQGGRPHQDREQGQISPDVVIALRVNQTLQSNHLYSTILTTGSGDVFVFQNGTVTQGTWSRSDALSPLVFTDQSGKVIELNRGQTWVTAVGQGRNISWQ
jgi:hypothetical protein